MSDDVDPRLWRTELIAPGPYSSDAPNEWTLRIDGRLIARTPDPLTNGQAHDWARRQMGEGVRFEPVLQDQYAEQALADGRRIDWVATPTPRRRAARASRFAAIGREARR